MNIFIWIAQILLALVFAGSGFSKLVQPYEKLAARMAYVNDYTQGVIRAIGTLEVLGAIGVVLPVLTGILPWLTPLAALGLSLIQILAFTTVHLPKKEYNVLPVNLVLLLLSMFVLYGRWEFFQ
jgi:uncharacterized membrane protein YphA (DoxX/SURF4 family)